MLSQSDVHASLTRSVHIACARLTPLCRALCLDRAASASCRGAAWQPAMMRVRVRVARVPLLGVMLLLLILSVARRKRPLTNIAFFATCGLQRSTVHAWVRVLEAARPREAEETSG